MGAGPPLTAPPAVIGPEAAAPAPESDGLVIECPTPVDLAATVGAFRTGGRDPSFLIESYALWWARRTPEGPVTLRISRTDGRRIIDGPTAQVTATAWGPGAAWALPRVPTFLGNGDTTAFVTDHPLVSELHRRHPGLRFGASQAVAAAVIPIVIEQRVTVIEALRSYQRLARALGDPAPGPGEARAMRLGPDPARLAQCGYADLHRFGIERRRADAVLRVCRRAEALDALVDLPDGEARAMRALAAMPGIGPWTCAHVAQRAFGNPDAVVVGDYHFPHIVAWSLAGEPRGDDARMLELLEPFAGHRARVVRLLLHGGGAPPRRGPRAPLRDFRRW